MLAISPFILVLLAYAIGSGTRLADNPADKLLPGLGALGDAINRMAFTPDVRTGELFLWVDTLASLGRLGASLAIATAIALVTGMLIGMFPYIRSLLAPFIAVVSMVPPLALLPVLFIVLGLGEVSKVALIVIGITPIMIRDLAFKVLDLPHEQLVKAQTLDASSWQIAMRVVLPQTLPRLLTCLKLQLGPAWLFLIAAEAISSDSGLGYRIFLVRRYLSMDVIFTYVIWITLLAVVMNLLLDWLRVTLFPWTRGSAA
jgi:NitT/TauT family transport system permease protein